MRLFVAVNFPEDVRAQWAAETAPLRAVTSSARWVTTPQLHLTVAFLGEQPDAIVDPLRAALDHVGRRYSTPLALEVAGIGAFPTWRRPRVVWLGVRPQPLLMTLAADVISACRALGVALENRPFHPHVTLGRLADRAPRDDVRTLERVARAVTGRTLAYARSIDLMVSALGRGGATHELLHRAQLGPTSLREPRGDRHTI